MPKIDIAALPVQQITSYPAKFAAVIAGREKQRLGDAVGLTQFGVNITRIGQFRLSLATLARAGG